MLDRKGDLSSAIQEYQSAIRLKPDYARAHLNLGMALARTGRLQDAIFEVQEALRLRPDFPEAQQSLGALLEMPKTK
jgi:Flp pilus assembly protein TadD